MVILVVMMMMVMALAPGAADVTMLIVKRCQISVNRFRQNVVLRRVLRNQFMVTVGWIRGLV